MLLLRERTQVIIGPKISKENPDLSMHTSDVYLGNSISQQQQKRLFRYLNHLAIWTSLQWQAGLIYHSATVPIYYTIVKMLRTGLDKVLKYFSPGEISSFYRNLFQISIWGLGWRCFCPLSQTSETLAVWLTTSAWGWDLSLVSSVYSTSGWEWTINPNQTLLLLLCCRSDV